MENILIKQSDNKSSKTYIAFTGLAQHGFEFVKTLEKLDCNAIFIQDNNYSWYQNGVDGLGKTPDDIVKYLKKLVESLNTKELITLGDSAGGYASLLFGSLLKADRIIAFGPQIFLSPKLREDFQDFRWASEYKTISKLYYGDLSELRIARKTKIELYVGEEDFLDILHCCYLEKNSTNVLLKIVPLAVHGVAQAIKQDNALTDIIDKGDQNNTYKLMSSVQKDFFYKWIDQAKSVGLSNDFKIDALSDILNKIPNWAVLNLMFGQILMTYKRNTEAELYFNSIFQNMPSSHKTVGKAYFILAQIAFSNADYQKCIDIVLSVNNHDTILGLQTLLGQSLYYLEKFDDAKEILEKVSIKSNNNVVIKCMLADIELLKNNDVEAFAYLVEAEKLAPEHAMIEKIKLKRENCLIKGSPQVITHVTLEETNDYLIKKYEGATKTVIAFSGLGIAEGKNKFEYAGTLSKYKVNFIVVRDVNLSWFQTPLGDLGSTFDEKVNKLREKVNLLACKNVYTFGMSMGGYAALVFGSLLKVNKVLAFAPQVFIDDFNRLKYLDDRWHDRLSKVNEYQYADLTSMINENIDIKYEIFWGLDDVQDFFHLLKIYDFNNVKTYGIDGGHHAVGLTLKEMGLLQSICDSNFSTGDYQYTTAMNVESKYENLIPFGKDLMHEIEVNDIKASNIIVKYEIKDYLNTNRWGGGEYFLARILLKENKKNEAKILLLKSIESLPKNSKIMSFALYNLAILLMGLNEYEKAISIINKGLKIEPNSFGLLTQLAFCNMQIKEYPEAKKILLELFDRSPTNISILFHLGKLNFSKEEYKEAKTYFEKIVSLNTQHYHTLFHLGVIAELEGKYEKAEKYFSDTLFIHPSHSTAKKELEELKNRKYN